jgi:hypothetical protein
MPKRSSKPKRPDVNQIAAGIIRAAAGGRAPEIPVTPEGKNAAGVALGRLGGKKGGPARMKVLSKKRRSEIAKEAARARGNKKN